MTLRPTLSDQVEKISSELYDQYWQLYAYEQAAQQAADKQLSLCQSAWASAAKWKWNLSQRRLRVHIFNTYENQSFKNHELDTLKSSEYLRSGPPSWTLKLVGSLNSNKASDSTSSKNAFTSFFSKILILTEDETILWDQKINQLQDSDGLEIHRSGSKEQNIKILFFVKYQTPIYRLSNKLANIVGNSHASLAAITHAIWKQIQRHNLVLNDGNITIQNHEPLKTIFENIDTFSLSDIPQLLHSHIFPPKPICVTHQLRLHGDWTQNESTYEFYMDSIESLPGIHESWLPHISSLSSLHQIEKSIEQKTDSIDRIIRLINQLVTTRNIYDEFKSSPHEFITRYLTELRLDERHPEDRSFISEYNVAHCRSEFYRQPWVSRAINRYNESMNISFEDQISKVVDTMGNFDPRKSLHLFTKHSHSHSNKKSRLGVERGKSKSVLTAGNDKIE